MNYINNWNKVNNAFDSLNNDDLVIELMDVLTFKKDNYEGIAKALGFTMAEYFAYLETDID